MVKSKRPRLLPRRMPFCYLRGARSTEVKFLILATASAVALSSFAMAMGRSASADTQDLSAAIVVGVPQHAGAAVKLAMGPTSAPRLPGGPVNQSSGMNSKCSPLSDSCHNLHKNAKYRHKSSSQN